MVSFMKLLAVAAVISSLVKDASGIFSEVGVAAGENIEQFSLLCRIYNVAEDPPINHADTQDFMKAFEVINAINASLAAEEWFNEIEKATGHENISEDFKKAHPDYEKQWDAWKTAVTKVSSGNEYSRVNSTTREAKLVQLRIQKITHKAHKIIEEIRKVNVTKEVGEMKDEFNKVIFGGREGNETDFCNSALSGVNERAAACGRTGLSSKGESAGKNLVVDFFCLCAGRSGSGTSADEVGRTDACGTRVGGNKIHYGWSEAGPWGSSTMWAEVKAGCVKIAPQKARTTDAARALIDKFLNHLEKGGVYRWGDHKGNGRKPGMLGTSMGSTNGKVSDLLCDGKWGRNNENPVGGICVYYGEKRGEWENIDWLKKFKRALDTVDILNKQIASIQSAVENLKMLQHRAEEIYETAKDTLEIENRAHSATRSRSYHNGYILPWALLI